MENPATNPLDSVLSYVAGRTTKKDDTLRERGSLLKLRLTRRSWIVAANGDGLGALFSRLAEPLPASWRDGRYFLLLNCNCEDRFESNVMGWDATNPYEDSMLSNFSLHLPDTSTDTTEGLNGSRQFISDTLEPFTLPGTLLPQPALPSLSDMPTAMFQSDAHPLGLSSHESIPLAPPTTSLRQNGNHSTLPYILPSNRKRSCWD